MDASTRLLKAKIPHPDTKIEIRKSICTICDPNTQCGLDLYVKDGRIIKVEGSLENPRNGGTLCSKGAATRQWVYHEQRIRTPLKRTGPRESGQFVPIGWAEALDMVTTKLKEIRASHGPEAVVFYCGYPKHLRPFLQRLALQFGSPNYCTESSTCFTAMQMAWRLTYGHLAAPDMANTRCVLIWSGNPLHSNTTLARRLFDAKARGVKFIVVDPRISPTASIADIHLAPRPGTDGALALGIANVIISENLYDSEFVASYARGFAEFREYVASFTPDKTAEIAGVPPEKIREAALLYATTKPACLMTTASPVVHHTNGVQNQRAVVALVGLTGNFDVPGGNVVQEPSWLEVGGAGFRTREHEFEMPRKWEELPPRVGALRFPVWAELVDQGQAMDLPRHITSGEPYPLKAMIGFGLNFRMWPGSTAFAAGLKQLDFICLIDTHLSDTTALADLVLPACTSVERSELRCYPEKYVIYTQPVIEPLGESRPDFDIIFALANKLELDDPLLNPQAEKAGKYLANGAPDFTQPYEAALNWILEPSGMTVEELKKHPGGMAVLNPTPVSFRKYRTQGFATPSGKMEFVSSLLEKYASQLGIDALPSYREPKYSPLSTPEIASRYPFVLNTGSRLPMFVHSRTYRLPWTRGLRRLPMADLNPADAAKLSIAQGDKIILETPGGSITVYANLTHMVQPGVVHMYHSHPEADVNTLLEEDYLDPISGFPGFKSSLCAVRKASEKE